MRSRRRKTRDLTFRAVPPDKGRMNSAARETGSAGVWPRRLSLAVGVAIAVLYLVPFPYFERLNSPNENARAYMVEAIVDHGTLSVDPVLKSGRPYIVDLARRDGHLYSIKAPGPSLLGVPFYWAATRVGPLARDAEMRLLRLVASTIPALLLLWFLARFLRRISEDAHLRGLALLGLAVGSMYYTHAELLAGHETAATALAGGFLCAYFNRERARDSAALLVAAGFLIAFGVASEYQAFPAGVAIALYALWGLNRRKNLVFLAAGALPPAVLVGLVHQACYGSPFHTGHHFPAEAAFQQYQQCGWRGMFCFSWAGLYGTFLSPANGLFFYAPWLWLALPGLFALFRRADLRAEAVTMAAVIASYFVTIAGMYAWKGGWSVGPRYLGATMPFLACAALAGLDAIARVRPAAVIALLPLWVVSMVLYGVSSVVFPHFPEDLQNPFFEFLLPLLRERRVPHTALEGVGVPGPWAAALLAAALAFLIGVAVWSAVRVSRLRARKAALAGGVALLLTGGLFFAMSRPATKDPARVAAALDLARQVWEPRAAAEGPHDP